MRALAAQVSRSAVFVLLLLSLTFVCMQHDFLWTSPI
jgi:hypothetical protein